MLTPAGIRSVAADNVLTVSATNGSDSTGTAGRLDKPFKTLGAAQTAAVSGQTIVVYPGSYAITTALGKNGVNWHLEPGATITATSTPSISRSVFADGGVAMSFTITGKGTLICNGPKAGSNDTTGCVSIDNASSFVIVHAQKLQIAITDPTGAAWCLSQTAGKLWATVDELTVGDPNSYCINWANGEMRVAARVIDGNSAGTGAVAVSAATMAPVTGDLHVHAETILGAIGVRHNSDSQDAKIWIRANWIDCTGAAVLNSGGKTYIEAQKISGFPAGDDGSAGANPGVVTTDDLLWLTAQKITSTNLPAISVRSGDAVMEVQQLEDLFSVMPQAIKVAVGTLYLNGTTAAMGAGDGTICSSGTAHLNGCTITTPGGKHDIVQSSTGTVIVHPSTTGSNADGSLKISGTVVSLGVVPTLPSRLNTHYSDIGTAADGATITFALDTNDRWKTTLGGNRTLALSGGHDGQAFRVTIYQGAGSNTVTWWSGITWFTSDGNPPTLASGAGKATKVMFERTAAGAYDGHLVGTQP